MRADRHGQWLDKFAVSRLDSKKAAPTTVKRTATASKRTKAPTAATVTDKTTTLVMSRDQLPGAVNGNTVKYRDTVWRVVNANYKDAKGEGIVLQRQSAIDVNKKITDPQTKAYTDPGNVYDYEVRDTTEVPDFQEAAKKTEQQIAAEHAHDYTTPAGRVTNPQPLVDEDPFAGVDDDLEGSAPDDVEPEMTEPKGGELPRRPSVKRDVEVDDRVEASDDGDAIGGERRPSSLLRERAQRAAQRRRQQLSGQRQQAKGQQAKGQQARGQQARGNHTQQASRRQGRDKLKNPILKKLAGLK